MLLTCPNPVKRLSQVYGNIQKPWQLHRVFEILDTKTDVVGKS